MVRPAVSLFENIVSSDSEIVRILEFPPSPQGPEEHGETPVEIEFLHPFVDLAVLRADEQFAKSPLFPGFEKFVGKQGLIYAGYSPSKRDTEGAYVLLLNQVATYDRETRSRTTGDEELITFASEEVEGGHSGGPILGEGGGVVAVIIQDYWEEDSQPRCRATGIQSLLRHLRFTKEPGPW